MPDIPDSPVDDGSGAWADHAQPPDGWKQHPNSWERECCGVTLTVSLARDVWYVVITGYVHFPGIRLPGVSGPAEARERAVKELRDRLTKIIQGWAT